VAAVWHGDTPIGLAEDLERLAGDLVDVRALLDTSVLIAE